MSINIIIMAKELKVGNSSGRNTPSIGNNFENNKSRIQLMLMITISVLILSIFFIVIELPLAAGICVILGACLVYMISRRIIYLIFETNEKLHDVAHSNEKQEDVISEFSHKIREPLNNLVIIGDILMESGLNNKQKELLETFIASTNNMVTTVNELTMEAAENISFEFRKHIKFNLLTTIQNTIELFNSKDKTNIEFALECIDNSDFEFIGDPIILKQIYLDLFNTIENLNADKKIIVTLNLKKNKQSIHESQVEMSIHVSRNLLLIDLQKTPTSLAARLISSNNGSFEQQAKEDDSILNIYMPFARAITDSKKQISSLKIDELKQKISKKKELKDINVLLVEDNVINQRITLLTLKPLVKNIEAATNGKEALDMFGTSKYDLILMDIQMPVMNGLVAAEKIRALEASTNSHVPIIAITANAMLGDKESCMSAGIDDYISKPFQPSVLIEKIKRFL
jgi:CheY-like chemotaxis protein